MSTKATISIPRVIKGSVRLPLSKSECNRLLIIRALLGSKNEMQHISSAQDSQVLYDLLERARSGSANNVYDCGAAGTTLRFLTAYFATLPGTRVLTGTSRLQKRPIGVLVDALRQLGAQITYKGEEGFAPIEITGAKLRGGQIELDGSISSQFVTALLLIGPTLHNGLVIHFKGPVTSMPYILMTLRIMERFNVFGILDGDTLSVSNQSYQVEDAATQFNVEADWSAASYCYALAAIADEADIFIEGLKPRSLQGDAVTALLFPFLGVTTTYENGGARLTKNGYKPKALAFDFEDCPDIVQTCAVVAAAKKIPMLLRGLNTLRIKETDRIQAMITELTKLGVGISEPEKGIVEIKTFDGTVNSPLEIETYEDHRMAMAFTPLAIQYPELVMYNPNVVSKSWPEFWEEMKKLGATIR